MAKTQGQTCKHHLSSKQHWHEERYSTRVEPCWCHTTEPLHLPTTLMAFHWGLWFRSMSPACMQSKQNQRSRKVETSCHQQHSDDSGSKEPKHGSNKYSRHVKSMHTEAKHITKCRLLCPGPQGVGKEAQSNSIFMKTRLTSLTWLNHLVFTNAVCKKRKKTGSRCGFIWKINFFLTMCFAASSPNTTAGKALHWSSSPRRLPHSNHTSLWKDFKASGSGIHRSACQDSGQTSCTFSKQKTLPTERKPSTITIQCPVIWFYIQMSALPQCSASWIKNRGRKSWMDCLSPLNGSFDRPNVGTARVALKRLQPP